MASKKPTKAIQAERTALLLQGVIAMLFGIAAVFWPGLTSVTLAYLFAFFLLFDGAIALALGLVRIKNSTREMLILLLGFLELGAGLYLINNPEMAFATLILLLGLALIARGLFALMHAFTGLYANNVKIMHAMLGVLGVVIGIFILVQPVAGGLAFVWILGLYALVAGPVMIAMSTDLGRR